MVSGATVPSGGYSAGNSKGAVFRSEITGTDFFWQAATTNAIKSDAMQINFMSKNYKSRNTTRENPYFDFIRHHVAIIV